MKLGPRRRGGIVRGCLAVFCFGVLGVCLLSCLVPVVIPGRGRPAPAPVAAPFAGVAPSPPFPEPPAPPPPRSSADPSRDDVAPAPDPGPDPGPREPYRTFEGPSQYDATKAEAESERDAGPAEDLAERARLERQRTLELRRAHRKGARAASDERDRQAAEVLSEMNRAAQAESAPGGRVNVRGYYRSDGTYVRPHTRSR